MDNNLNQADKDIQLICDALENSIECKILNEESELYEYAFYLKRNDERVDTIWYSKEKNVRFKIREGGMYVVSAFVKNIETEELKILTSEEMMFEAPKRDCEFSFKDLTIDIFGSCVSRDLFEVEKTENFKVGNYVARQSILSAVSPAIEYDDNAIQLQSAFQKRMVQLDLDSKGLVYLNEAKSDYFIIDLIDERFDLGKKADSIFTLSNEFTLSKVMKAESYEVIKKDNKFLENFETIIYQSIDRFCDEILKIYEPNHIIIHKAYMVNYYYDKNGKSKKFSLQYLYSNKRINTILSKMYAYIEEKIPGAIVIDICNQFGADENHKWGLAPKHYQKEYYVSVLNEISNQMNGVYTKEGISELEKSSEDEDNTMLEEVNSLYQNNIIINEKYRQSTENYRKLQIWYTSLQEKTEALQKQNEKLATRNRELEKANEGLKSQKNLLEKENANLEVKNSTLEKRNEKLQTMYKSFSEKEEVYKECITKLQDDINANEKILKSVLREIEEKEAKMKTLEWEASRYRKIRYSFIGKVVSKILRVIKRIIK